MSLHTLRREIKGEIFDYQILTYHLKDLKYPRAKISRLLKTEEIIRIKKGLYAFGDPWRQGEINLEIAANLIYGPSCISFEYALFHYGMIADRAVAITSLTLGRKKEFHTPIGTFRYHAIDEKKFSIGIEYQEIEGEGGFFIASKEKAIADTVSKIKKPLSKTDFHFYLFEEMRLHETSLEALDRKKLREIGSIYRNKLVDYLYE